MNFLVILDFISGKISCIFGFHDRDDFMEFHWFLGNFGTLDFHEFLDNFETLDFHEFLGDFGALDFHEFLGNFGIGFH